MTDEAEKTWGGRRAGAGRKPQDNARNIRASFSLSQKAADALAAYAQRHAISRNAAMNTILENLE